MYVSVSWEIIDGADSSQVIRNAVIKCFDGLQRCELLPNTMILAVRTVSQWNTLLANLMGVEFVYGPQFGFTLFEHRTGETFRCSEPYDKVAAQAITGVPQ